MGDSEKFEVWWAEEGNQVAGECSKAWTRKLWHAARLDAQKAAAQSVPEGWRLVPELLTEAMHVAAVRTIVRCNGNDDFPPRVYRAMLAAAPAQPAEDARDAEIARLREAAETALAAYQHRFGSVAPRIGSYLGPIDDEMLALRAAIAASKPQGAAS